MMKSVIWMITVHIAALVQSTIVASETINASKPLLSFVSLLPYPARIPSLQPSWDEGPTLFLAAELAVDHINNNADVLSDYEVELIQGDSGCDLEDKAVLAFVEHVLYSGKQVVGIVWPGCSTSALTVSPLSGREDIALINVHIAGSPLLGDREKYPYSFGTLGSTEGLVEASLAIIRQNNWTRVAALYDESRLHYYTTFQAFEQKINGFTGYSLVSYAIYDTFIPFDVLEEEDVRVIFLLAGSDLLSKSLCLAFHRRVQFPSHQWIFVSQTLDKAAETTFFYDRQHYSCNTEDIAQVVQGTVIIQYRLTPFDHSATTDTGLAYEGFLTQYIERITEYNQSPNNSDVLMQSFWATSYYDAVWALAWALNNSIAVLEEKNLSLLNYTYGHNNIGMEVREQLLQLDKEGVSGRIKFSNNTGYVSRAVDIYQVINNSMNLVAYYHSSGLFKVGDAEFVNSSGGQNMEIIIVRAPLSAAVVFLFFAVVALILIVSVHILSFVNRNYHSVKASSPKLNHFVYLGCYFIILATKAYIIVSTFDIPPDTQCVLYHIVNASAYLGMTLIFSTVCAKTWRIYRIFVHYLKPGRMISNRALLLFVTANLAVSVVVSILWISTDRLNPVVATFPTADGERVLARELCHPQQRFTSYIWIGMSICHDILLMLISLLLAILCYGIPNRDFKTNTVIIHVYTLLLVIIVGVPLYLFVLGGAVITAPFVTLSFTFLLAVYICFAFAFLPPFLPLLRSTNTGSHIIT